MATITCNFPPKTVTPADRSTDRQVTPQSAAQASQVAQWERMCLLIRETRAMQVPSPCGEDPLEKEMEPTPVFLPGESQGQRRLVGRSPQVTKSPT